MIDPEVKKRIRTFKTILYSILKSHKIEVSYYHDILKKASDIKEDDIFLDSIINKWDKLITRHLFALAQDFIDITALLTMFVQGLLPNSPTHKSPLVLESQKQIDPLETINGKYFCITKDSQPGFCNKNEKERAYLVFYTPCNTPFFHNLVKELYKNKSILFNLSSPNGQIHGVAEKTSSAKWKISKTKEITEKTPYGLLKGKAIDHCPQNNELIQTPNFTAIPLTVAKVKNETKKQEWFIHTTESLDLNPEYIHDWKLTLKYAKNVNKNILPPMAQITIVHRRFCKSNLLKIFLGILKRANK